MEGPPKKKYSRRKAINNFATAMVGGVLLPDALIYAMQEKDKENALERGGPHRGSKAEEEVKKEVSIESCEPESFATENLAGKEFRSLYAKYLGLPEVDDAKYVMIDTISVSYPKTLEALWQEKLGFMRHHAGNQSEDVRESHEDRVNAYAARWQGISEPPGQYHDRADALKRVSLVDEIMALDRRLAPIKARLGSSAFTEGLRRQYGRAFSPEQIEATLELAERIDARMLLAYSMTELFPNKDGEFNAQFYDFLLRTAGKEYVASIPAMHDNRLSFGALQFTTQGYDESKGHGASVINDILPPENQIQAQDISDIYDLDDQLVAGYLYAINILAYTLLKLPRSQYSAFREMEQGTLVDFVATSHNNPSEAYRAMSSWLGNKHKNNLRFIECCGNAIKLYGEKSAENYTALERMQFALGSQIRRD